MEMRFLFKLRSGERDIGAAHIHLLQQRKTI